MPRNFAFAFTVFHANIQSAVLARWYCSSCSVRFRANCCTNLFRLHLHGRPSPLFSTDPVFPPSAGGVQCFWYIPFSFSIPPSIPNQGLHCYPLGFDIEGSYTETIYTSSSAADICNDLGTDVYLECDQWLTDGAENEGSIDPRVTENEVARHCVVSSSFPLPELPPGTESTVIRAVPSDFLAPTYVNNVKNGHAFDLYYRTMSPTAQQEVHTENGKDAVTNTGLVPLQNMIGTDGISKTKFYRENDFRKRRKKRSRQEVLKELTSGPSPSTAIDIAVRPSGDRIAFRVKTVKPDLDDGFFWLKYGKKEINGSIHPRYTTTL